MRFRDHIWVKIYIFGLKLLYKSVGFEKHKIAHNSLNNGRIAVLIPFLDIDIFELFRVKIDFFRQIAKKMTNIEQKMTKPGF